MKKHDLRSIKFLLIGTVYFALLAEQIYLLNGLNIVGALIIIENIILFSMMMYVVNTNDKLINQNSQLLLDKQQADNRVDECNKSFHEVFNNSSDGIALLNLDLNFFKVNQSLCQILGFNMEKILQWNLKNFFYGNTENEHQYGINKLITNQNNLYTYRKNFIKKNGDILQILIVITLVRDKSNQPHYFIMRVTPENHS